MNRLRAVIIGAALTVALPCAPALARDFRPIEIQTSSFENFAVAESGASFGELEFRGGLVLSSPDREFGALSGLAIGADGKSLLAVADTGLWVRGTLVESNGRLTGLTDGSIAPILDSKGELRPAKRFADAESLRLTSEDGHEVAVVAFEQSGEVSRFDARDLANASARSVKLPADARTLPANYGLETIAIAPASSPLAGATVVVEERAGGRDGTHRAWIIGGPKAGAFSIRHVGNYDITDGDFLPNGDLVILERLFNPTEGLGARVRRIPAAEIAPGKVAHGTIVLTANLNRHRIDNMEGLTLRAEPDGETSLFIVSDDNKSFLQQTLLLKFAWRAPDTQ